MSRYIDIDKAIPIAIQAVVDVVGHGISQVDAVRIAERLEDAPTADVVEVVRCKDCKYCETLAPVKEIGKEAVVSHRCILSGAYKKPDGFCDYGERRGK